MNNLQSYSLHNKTTKFSSVKKLQQFKKFTIIKSNESQKNIIYINKE